MNSEQRAEAALTAAVAISVLGGLLVGAVLMSISGANPIAAYVALFMGAFGDYNGFATTLTKASPILLDSLAVLVPLRVGLYNIGGQGQMYIGALAATVAALYLPRLPCGANVLVCAIAGMLGGLVWAAVAAWLRAFRGVNEVIVTLLMNYVAIDIVSFAVSGPLMEPGAPYPYSRVVPRYTQLPRLFPDSDAHYGVLVAVVLAGLIWALFRRTAFGYSLLIVGQSQRAARLAGISVESRIIAGLCAGGALAGLAGTFEIIGLKHRLFHLFGAEYGYDGIVVAFLAVGNPLWAIVSGIFFSGLRSGANAMQRAVAVPTTVVEAVQGVIVVAVAAGAVVAARRGQPTRRGGRHGNGLASDARGV